MYCSSRFATVRRASSLAQIGSLAVGAGNPIRIQSMTTTDTQDVAATVKQAIALAEVGCEVVRVTAPNKAAAAALKEIRAGLSAAGFANTPLVADIHFLPNAAMEAVEHVEKVRVNPGNYADRKKFLQREYTDSQYDEEMQRLHESFTPLVKRAKALGRCLRIGTNHGSLSDRIMNRYGDTPLGMVESALEFLRIAESHSFKNMILSMKASNPKVMIQAYRLLVERMDQEKMAYPLHLGVTEAGDGEDGRIKSAIGIGSLLLDGLGDTIRVSLTEDPVYEIPVAQALAKKTMALWTGQAPVREAPDSIDPYVFTRRHVSEIRIGKNASLGVEQPPTVLIRSAHPIDKTDAIAAQVGKAKPLLKDTPAEGILVSAETVADLACVKPLAAALAGKAQFLAVSLSAKLSEEDWDALPAKADLPLALHRDFGGDEIEPLAAFLTLCDHHQATPLIGLTAESVSKLSPVLTTASFVATLAASVDPQPPRHAVGSYRRLVEALDQKGIASPIWIRNTAATAIRHEPEFLSRLLEASMLSGALLGDGLGDMLSVETESDFIRAAKLSYNVLQGAGARISKTEFVACPSCGRTLFDLQSTTQRIREKTGHLKGVKIAIMGCIVNGPGEMADADFGYVGGAPAKINLYVGKECVQYNIPQAEADQRLVELIKAHGKWFEPELVAEAQ